MTQITVFNREKHRMIMMNILIDIYRDYELSRALGFK